MIEGLLVIVGLCLFPCLGGWTWIRTWRDGFSPYETGGPFSRLWGDYARHGYDAGFPVFMTLVGCGLAIISGPIGMESMGHPVAVDSAVGEVLGRTCQVLMVLGLAVGWSLLLFMFPSFLVPPHLRGQRGWVAEWRYQRRMKRDRRRARTLRGHR